MLQSCMCNTEIAAPGSCEDASPLILGQRPSALTMRVACWFGCIGTGKSQTRQAHKSIAEESLGMNALRVGGPRKTRGHTAQ